LVHQEGAAVDQLSIGENVMLTLEPNQYGIIAWPALHERAASALGQLGVSADTQQRLGEHGGVALTELIEIARSIVRGGSVFVFDESTAALGVEEIGNLLQRMRELARSGASVIFISHRIQEILSICDRVVVIRDGRKVLDAPRAELDHATVVAAMLAGIANRQSSGRLAESPHLNDHTSPGALLQLKNWRRPRSERSRVDLGPINLEIGRGEIFGIFGPLGAGKTELLESLFGLSESLPHGGFQWDSVKRRPPSDPHSAIEMGLAFVSADRQKQGVIPQLSLLENMLLGNRRTDLSRGRFALQHQKAREICQHYIDALGIRAQGPDQLMSTLSGGNQQKVLLARAMLNRPRLLLLDEPTRGIDVGTKREVYSWISATGRAGQESLARVAPSQPVRAQHRMGPARVRGWWKPLRRARRR
jgi:ABC-type sugar transport system ATPase subunit